MNVTAVTQPVQVAMVKGDYHKYEAMTWQNRGYSGGVKDLSIHYTSSDDVTMDASGSGVIGNGDYKGAYSITKKDEGYLKFDFKQFRKYYDTYGGTFQGLSRSLSRDLFLDIGHFGIEAGITRPDIPSISVYYDHDYRVGSKSMLNWDSLSGTIASKKIAPSWKEIDQTVDTFGIKGDYTEKGYHLTGDQRWELVRGKTRGYEQAIVANRGLGTQARQDSVPETTVMTTLFGVDKWYWEDKVFGSSAYRFQHLKNQVRENITHYTNGVVPAASGENHFDATAHNEQDLNSWVINLMVSPWSWLSGTSNFKAEASNRNASAYYPLDNAWNGIVDNTSITFTDSSTYKLAESFGLRFKAIPRTVVYADLSFEQSQNHLKVNRTSRAGEVALVGSEIESRDAIIREPAVTWTTGVDFQPVRFINLTSQFRLREKDMDFKDGVFRKVPSSGRRGQVFLQWMHTKNLGFTQRATAHLSSWAQTSFRYLYDATDYTTLASYDNVNAKANMLSNTFIYDVSVFPLSNLSMTGSLSQQLAETKTVAASRSPLTPAFTSNYFTWMFTTDYQPQDKVHLDGSLFYTFANNNGNNQDPNLVNYASAFDQLGLTVGCKWDVNKDLSVKPQYGFQRYLPGKDSGIGGAYDAQVVSLAITTTWG